MIYINNKHRTFLMTRANKIRLTRLNNKKEKF